MIRAGILSDTHLSNITDSYRYLVKHAFADCDIIFHAGDITNIEIMKLFDDKVLHAVHGNMCDGITRQKYPHSKAVVLEGYTIGLCHGAGPRHTIQDRMWSLFPEADCIIYGHTHEPVIQSKGDTLFINPGSFQCSSYHGSPASYATLNITQSGLQAKLHTLSLKK